MILRPPGLGRAGLVGWRLDRREHAADWDVGEGARLAGGRWNSRGVRAVYASLDAATAVLEVAVHKGFHGLDTVPHVLTAFEVLDPDDVHVVDPADIPNPNWLRPGLASAGQRAFGDALLATHRFIAVPSTVARHGWNLIFDAERGGEGYTLRFQEAFALDGRLNPAP